MTLRTPESARHEIKFVAYHIHYHHILHWLHLHPAGFIVPYPERWVNNIYFDTADYTAYTDNLLGASARTKVRYRWYGKSQTPAAGTLEIKQKRNYFGWKLHFEINDAPYTPGANWKGIYQLLSRQLPPKGKNWLDTNPLPVLINRYFRKYFVSADGKFRVTLDNYQTVWDQRFKMYPNFSHRAILPNTFVVELKFDRTDGALASQLIQGIPIRVSRHSKYINGVRAISGN
ncbi:MAG TPA: polyphosphate polymerase domain-containing protein [Thioploca sp.]|nr:MAG: hypothetical protein DRR19_06725 [Gammaproteobacteria bacterium]HDN27914.1 polyphosphate polymerase domain-containing protein [Thioploca sp.]